MKAFSAKSVMMFSLGFWLTAIIMRLVIFWAFLQNKTPAVYFHSHHIHHFVFGFFLLFLAGLVYFHSNVSGKLLLLVAGIGSGLMFDEFLYWTRGLFDYWNLYNFFALALGAGVCLVAYAYAKRNEINRQLKLPGEKQKFAWMLAPFGIYLLLLYSMFIMQHSMLAQAKEKRSVKSTLQTLSYQAKNRLLSQRLIKPIFSLDKD